MNLRRNLLPWFNGRLVRAGSVNLMCLNFTTRLLMNLESLWCEGAAAQNGELKSAVACKLRQILDLTDEIGGDECMTN